MTPAGPIRYRKMPGHLRGPFGGSSFWAGPDHFLLVRSNRFAETYKRFYYRDIQAIAVADTPRFYVPALLFLLGLVWLLAIFWISAIASFQTVAAQQGPAGANVFARLPLTTLRFDLLLAGLLVALLWAVVSWVGSCRCRIYTAVSSDEIPSVYRRWVARRFLDAVNPIIAQRQGELPPDWTQAAAAAQAQQPPAPVPAAFFRDTSRSRSFASDALIGSLFLASAVKFVHWPNTRIDNWASVAAAALIAVCSVAVMIHRQRRLVRASMQTLAIITLAVMGVLSYGQTLTTAAYAGYEAGRTKRTVVTQIGYTDIPWMRPGVGAIYAILGAVGIALSMQSGGAAASTRPE